MIDTITFMVEGQPDVSFFEPRLTDFKKIFSYKHQDYSFTGFLRNMYVRLYYNQMIITGSLNRYYMGSNVHEFTLKEIRTAIEDLSSTLNIDMRTAQVFRLDLALNLKMDHPVESYLDAFIRGRPTGRYQKAEYAEETVSFMNKRRTVQFYDKLAEMKQRKEDIPLELQDLYLLRCEVQFKNRLKAQFKKKITLDMLGQNNFFREALNWYENEMLETRMQRQYKLLKPVNVKSFKDYLALKGLISLGGEEVGVKMIKKAKKEGNLNKMQSYRLIEQIRKLANLPHMTTENDLAQEFKTKLKLAVDYQRLFLN